MTKKSVAQTKTDFVSKDKALHTWHLRNQVFLKVHTLPGTSWTRNVCVCVGGWVAKFAKSTPLRQHGIKFHLNFHHMHYKVHNISNMQHNYIHDDNQSMFKNCFTRNVLEKHKREIKNDPL